MYSSNGRGGSVLRRPLRRTDVNRGSVHRRHVVASQSVHLGSYTAQDTVQGDGSADPCHGTAERVERTTCAVGRHKKSRGTSRAMLQVALLTEFVKPFANLCKMKSAVAAGAPQLEQASRRYTHLVNSRHHTDAPRRCIFLLLDRTFPRRCNHLGTYLWRYSHMWGRGRRP